MCRASSATSSGGALAPPLHGVHCPDLGRRVSGDAPSPSAGAEDSLLHGAGAWAVGRGGRPTSSRAHLAWNQQRATVQIERGLLACPQSPGWEGGLHGWRQQACASSTWPVGRRRQQDVPNTRKAATRAASSREGEIMINESLKAIIHISNNLDYQTTHSLFFPSS